MQSVLEVMLSTIQSSKEAGSYFLFYLLALGLGLTIAWDRYGKNKMEDNWMVEETKKQLHLWPFLYSLSALVLVAANPIAIFVLNRFTPVSGQFYKVWPLVLPLFLIAYGITCFLSILGEKKQRVILVLGCVLLIGLSGSSYGIMADRQSEEDITEEKQVLKMVSEVEEEVTLLAADKVLEYAGIYNPEFKLVYGKDLYTPNMDLGIMDTYPPQLLNLYEAMKNPEECMEDITAMAAMYDCNVIVVPYYEEAPSKSGVYYQTESTENYLIYTK